MMSMAPRNINMTTITDINLFTWFSEREMNFAPPHFVYAAGKISPETKQWVLEKLSGRFHVPTTFFPITKAKGSIAFEDPAEALFYELKWA